MMNLVSQEWTMWRENLAFYKYNCSQETTQNNESIKL